jgi:hypothetical protein
VAKPAVTPIPALQTRTAAVLRRLAERVAARLGIDLFELGALAVLGALSLAVILPLLTRGRPLSGADGSLAADQLQYFAWIREASENILIGNRYDLAPGERTFLHPGFLLSGLVHAATGLSISLSYLLWKPVAVGVTFYGCLRYIRRLLPAGGRRRVALVLALFAVMPAAAAVAWTGWGGRPREYIFGFISGEMWSAHYLWGYLMTAIAVFLMPFVLLALERWRDGAGRPRTLWLAGLGALVVCWLQPWQGATLALIVVAVEAFRWATRGERPRLALLLIPAAVALPAVYYHLLSVHDPSWTLASESNAAGAQPAWKWPWWAMVLTLGPLAAPAALAYRLPAPSWQEQAVRVWPFAALAVYLAPVGTFPYHAFQGLALPLAILAVQGVASVWPRPRLAFVVGAVALMTLPGFADKLETVRGNVHAGGDPYFIFPGELRALEALEEDPRPGGVLGATYAGYMLPHTTGRETYVGALSWSPNWSRRSELANALVEGRLVGARGRAFVRSTRARFVFGDCRPALPDLTATLRPLLEDVMRFGCATVYVLRERPEVAEAAGPPDA